MKNCKFGLQWIFFLAVASVWGNSAATAKLVGVDGRSRWGGDENILASGSRFNKFRQAIVDNGYSFVPLNSFDSDSLEGLDALILTTPGDYLNGGSQYSYTQTELNAIHDFSRRAVIIGDTTLWADPVSGYDFYNITSLDNRRFLDNCLNYVTEIRGVLMMLDIEYNTDFSNLQNLVAPYGVQFEDQIYATGNVLIDEFGDHPITSGITSIGINQYARFGTIGSPAIDLVIGRELPDVIASVPEPASVISGLVGLFFAPGFLKVSSLTRSRMYGTLSLASVMPAS